MTGVPVTCSVCKAPFQVYGVEPPLEYVCAACTQASETPDPTQPCDFCGARVLGDGEVLGDGNLMCYRCMLPSARPHEELPPVADEVAEGLGGRYACCGAKQYQFHYPECEVRAR